MRLAPTSQFRAAAATALTLAATAALTLPAEAAEPRSAIPWLSESIETVAAPDPPKPPAPPSAPAAPRGAPIGPATSPIGGGAITVTPLPEINRDAIGLLPPEATGFARRLWGSQTAPEVRDAILAAPGTGVPEAQALFRRILLAEADVPEGAGNETSVLVARLDRLLQIGALEQAEALVLAAGPETPELFRRWFDTSLLLGRAAEPCAALRQNPALSPTLPARVFCLARGGDWNAAEITLTLGEQLGQIDGEQQALLARFLDPQLFEEAEEPPVPDPLTPLDFLMREAVGLPRPAGALPNAFLVQDLTERTPMRMRIDAAERLALSGGIGEAPLFEAYRSGEPAASGGVWDRASAVQNLDAALDDPAASGLPAALASADAALTGRGLRAALASAYADRLARLDASAWPGTDRDRLAELLLLAGRPEADAEHRSGLALPAAIAAGPQASPGAATELGRAAAAGLTAGEASDDRERHLAGLVAAGRQGEALLGALALLAEGPDVDPQGLKAALLTLRLAGQEKTAHTIALQTLFAEPGP